ncbi:MAG: antitermination protein NusB [Eggerthellaceae bacterium]|nr:antitermination protein NusB [Eggerthellaceae bacterium]
MAEYKKNINNKAKRVMPDDTKRHKTLSPAREMALFCTRIIRERDAYASDIIDANIDTSSMSREDRAFATRLILGVVSCVGTLDEVIDRCMNSASDADENVRDVLRISTYEILYLNKDAHAAVDQGVRLVRTFNPNATGFVNAILRRIVKAKEEFPFGNPYTDKEAFARFYAFPQWLSDMVIEELGEVDAGYFMKESNEPAPLFVALNTIKSDIGSFEKTLIKIHAPYSAVEIDGRQIANCAKLDNSRILQDPALSKMLKSGQLLVADAASQAVVQNIMPIDEPKSFLEIGAGRATKTILIQSFANEYYGRQIARYCTLDNLGFKSEIIKKRVVQYGVHVDDVLTGDATDLSAAVNDEKFDMVFIDAPCSGLGTLRRHPEIRWRIKPSAIDELANTGLLMLKSASHHVKDGGYLGYATCTITSKENTCVVKAFLDSDEGKGFRLDAVEGKGCFATKLYPGSPDAHFAVRFVKKGL